MRAELGPEALIFDEVDQRRQHRYRSFEGGDVLVLSPEVVMIGCSEQRRRRLLGRNGG